MLDIISTDQVVTGPYRFLSTRLSFQEIGKLIDRNILQPNTASITLIEERFRRIQFKGCIDACIQGELFKQFLEMLTAKSETFTIRARNFDITRITDFVLITISTPAGDWNDFAEVILSGSYPDNVSQKFQCRLERKESALFIDFLKKQLGTPETV